MSTYRSPQVIPIRRANTWPLTNACHLVREVEESLCSATINTRMHSQGRKTVFHHQFPASTQNQYSEYKKLLLKLSECLSPQDLQIIIFLKDLPHVLKKHSALDMLDYMDRRFFSPTDVQSLAGLLKDISRYDLVKDVEKYQQKYGKEGLDCMWWLKINSII